VWRARSEPVVRVAGYALKRAYGHGMRAKGDYAMLAKLFGSGFRRSELVGLELDHIQMRQGPWAVVDLIGKGGTSEWMPSSSETSGICPGEGGQRSCREGTPARDAAREDGNLSSPLRPKTLIPNRMNRSGRSRKRPLPAQLSTPL
jgi:integrase